MVTTHRHILSDDILTRCRERAPIYDQANRFFTEDFEELKNAGYLTMPVPQELDGPGMTLAEVCREQRRLAYHAAPTALAMNMHLYWVGVAAHLWRSGDQSLEWMLKGALNGEGSPPVTLRPATTCPCSSQLRKPSGLREATALQDASLLAALLRYGLIWDFTEWTPATLTPPKSSTLSCPRAPRGPL